MLKFWVWATDWILRKQTAGDSGVASRDCKPKDQPAGKETKGLKMSQKVHAFTHKREDIYIYKYCARNELDALESQKERERTVLATELAAD